MRDPLDERLVAGVGRDDQTVADLERRRVREERGGVPVRPEPVQDQVEGDAAHFLLVRRSGLLGVVLAADAVHGGGALLHPVEQGVLDQQVVRPGIVRGDATLVAPPELDLAPVGLQLGGDARTRAGASLRL